MRYVLLVLVALSMLALAPSAEASDLDYKAWAISWHNHAIQQHSVVVRASTALGLPNPPRVPIFIDSYRDWGTKCKTLTIYWRDTKIPALMWRLNHPTGTGIQRWWPTAIFVGWPASQKLNFIICVRRESGGNPNATNPYTGSAGLMQIHPVHASAFYRVTGKRFYRGAWEPLANVKYGRYIWLHSGWRPWGM